MKINGDLGNRVGAAYMRVFKPFIMFIKPEKSWVNTHGFFNRIDYLIRFSMLMTLLLAILTVWIVLMVPLMLPLIILMVIYMIVKLIRR